LKQAAFCLLQKMGSRRQASNRLFATPKPLVLLALKTVAKLTLCATSGKKNRRLFGCLYRFVYCLAVE